MCFVYLLLEGIIWYTSPCVAQGWTTVFIFFPRRIGSSFDSSINFEQVRVYVGLDVAMCGRILKILAYIFGSSFLATFSIDSDNFLLETFLLIIFCSLVYVAFALRLHIMILNYFNNFQKSRLPSLMLLYCHRLLLFFGEFSFIILFMV